MTSKIFAFLAVFLVATMASARRSTAPTSRRATFVGRHRKVTLPKLFDNRQVIVKTTDVSSDPSTMSPEEYSAAVKKLHNQQELVYLSFHGF